MKGTTTGEDFIIIFEETLEKYDLQWDKLVSITTDDAVEQKLLHAFYSYFTPFYIYFIYCILLFHSFLRYKSF